MQPARDKPWPSEVKRRDVLGATRPRYLSFPNPIRRPPLVEVTIDVAHMARNASRSANLFLILAVGLALQALAKEKLGPLVVPVCLRTTRPCRRRPAGWPQPQKAYLINCTPGNGD